MTIHISAGYWSDSARTKGEIKLAGENLISITKEMPGGTGETTATIASGSFTPVNNYAVYALETEASAVSDVLDHIATTNVRNGQIIGIRLFDDTHDITIDASAGGVGQIKTPDGFDIDMTDSRQIVWLKYNSTGTSWEVLDIPASIGMLPPGGAAAALVLASHPTSGSTRPSLRALSKEHLNTIMDTTVGWKAVADAAVSTNTITPTRAIHTIDTSAGTKTINTINTANMAAGRVLFISPSSSSNALTLTHQSGSAGTGRMTLKGGANATITSVDQGIWFVQESGDWREIDRCGFSATGLVQGIVNGRLCLASGKPVEEVAGSSDTIYFSPHRGNQLSTYDGAAWSTTAFTEKSLNIDALVKMHVGYDVFIVNGTQALEILAWKQVTASNSPTAGSNKSISVADTSGVVVGDWITVANTAWSTVEKARVNAVSTNTSVTVDTLANAYTNPVLTYNSRATAVVSQDGIPVKSGATTRLFLGSIYGLAGNGTTGGLIRNSTAEMYMYNAWNIIPHQLRSGVTTTSYTYASATARPPGGLSFNQGCVQWFCGLADGVSVQAHSMVGCNNTGGVAEVAIGIDSITTACNGTTGVQQLNAAAHAHASYRGRVGLGWHFATQLEACHAAATATFYGNAVSGTWPAAALPYGIRSEIQVTVAA